MAATRFYLIGPGAVGKVLARRLVNSGWECAGVCGRGSAAGRRLAKELRARYVSSVEHVQLDRGFLVLAVGTGQLASIAKELAKQELNWPHIKVLHLSGTLDTKPLLPLAELGATIGACHPYMTFPRFSGVVRAGSKEEHYDVSYPLIFGIDGDAKGLAACRKLAKACGGKSLVVQGSDRVAYHASAVLACTLLGANLVMAETILKKLGLNPNVSREAVLSIARETLSNFAEYGIDRSWTGPAVRGDRQTIAAHVRAIGKLDPEAAKVYKMLSEWVMKKQA